MTFWGWGLRLGGRRGGGVAPLPPAEPGDPLLLTEEGSQLLLTEGGDALLLVEA